jgi:hypothetical protein
MVGSASARIKPVAAVRIAGIAFDFLGSCEINQEHGYGMLIDWRLGYR